MLSKVRGSKDADQSPEMVIYRKSIKYTSLSNLAQKPLSIPCTSGFRCCLLCRHCNLPSHSPPRPVPSSKHMQLQKPKTVSKQQHCSSLRSRLQYVRNALPCVSRQKTLFGRFFFIGIISTTMRFEDPFSHKKTFHTSETPRFSKT